MFMLIKHNNHLTTMDAAALANLRTAVAEMQTLSDQQYALLEEQIKQAQTQVLSMRTSNNQILTLLLKQIEEEQSKQRLNNEASCQIRLHLDGPVLSTVRVPQTRQLRKEPEFHLSFTDEASDRQCEYVYQRDEFQCPNAACQGSHFCGPCGMKNLDVNGYGPLPKLPVGRTIRLEINLYDIYDDEEKEFYLTEEEVSALTKRSLLTRYKKIYSSDGTLFCFNECLLTGAGSFYREYFSDEIQSEIDVPTHTLQQFLHLLQGDDVVISHWRKALALFLWFKQTVVGYNDPVVFNRLVRAFHVDKEDYGEYISVLAKLYDNNIPKSVIDFSTRFLQ